MENRHLRHKGYVVEFRHLFALLSFQKTFLWHADPQYDVEDQATEGCEYSENCIGDADHHGVELQIFSDAATDACYHSVIRAP